MAQENLHQDKVQAHIDAMERHRLLLSELHLDSNERLNELSATFEEMALTFEEYLKVIGLP